MIMLKGHNCIYSEYIRNTCFLEVCFFIAAIPLVGEFVGPIHKILGISQAKHVTLGIDQNNARRTNLVQGKLRLEKIGQDKMNIIVDPSIDR